MTLTTVTSWGGGALWENPTLTTEPTFTAQGGIATSAVYSPAIGGESGQAVRVTGVRDFTSSISGNHWRLGVRIARVAGTQSAGHAALLFRSGTVNVGDIFLRNQNGGQWALRQGAGGTIYAGQSATATTNGETPWRIEVEYQSDGTTHTIKLYLFNPGNDSTTPNDTFTGTVASPIDNYRILNPTGTTGLTLDFGTVYYEDAGNPIWAGGATPGTLTFLSNVWASQNEAVFVGKVDGASNVSVTVGSETASGTPDSAGYFRLAVPGLAANSDLAWDLKVDSVSRRTGSIKTMPTSANGLMFMWGSCFDTYTSQFFNYAAARNPRFFIQLGDWGYQYITGGPNGNTSPTDIALVRQHREAVLTAALPQSFFTKQPTGYTVSDCDGGGANADGTTGGLANGVVQAAYRQQFAHPTLPLTNSGARSWVIGRVRFIQTDETVAASNKALPDGYRDNPTPENPSVPNPDKTKLGAEQKTWFKAQIDAAVAANQAVVWFGDGPWITPTQITGNEWRAYPTERAELGNYIKASGVKLVRLHGDSHTLFADDGTNNPWGGFPTASSAPMHTTANPYSPAVSNGKWPTVQTNSSRHEGIAEIVDDGTDFALRVRGYSSTNSAPEQVLRFDMTVDLSPEVPVTYPAFVEVVGGVEKPMELFEVVGGVERPLTVEIVS